MLWKDLEETQWGQTVPFKYIQESRCTNMAWTFPFHKERTLEILKILSLRYRALSSAFLHLPTLLCFHWNQLTLVGGSWPNRSAASLPQLWKASTCVMSWGLGGLSYHSRPGQRHPAVPADGAYSFSLRCNLQILLGHYLGFFIGTSSSHLGFPGLGQHSPKFGGTALCLLVR